MLTIRF